MAAQASFEKFGCKGKRKLFLDQMEQVVPWSELLSLVKPHYPKAGNGRHPVGLSIMLRTYFLKQWFNLSGPGMEEAFYDSAALRRFVGMDPGVAAAPDQTTILRFRRLLEKQIWRRDAGFGQWPSCRSGHSHQDGYDLGCDYHSRAQFDRELDQ